MPQTITYSLRSDNQNSDTYYHTIAAFVDEWVSESVEIAKDTISLHQAYRYSNRLPPRSEAEYALELLVIGILLREHAVQAEGLPAWSVQALAALVKSQTRSPKIESIIKILRGWINGILIISTSMKASFNPSINGTLEDLRALLNWLRTNGENGIADRLSQWEEHLNTVSSDTVQEAFACAFLLAEKFDIQSPAYLGKYTENIGNFLSKVASRYRWRHDAALLSKSRSEYHCSMLATEILNRAYRERFLSAHRKIVIVPPCMRAQPDGDCKAIETPLGAQCQACKPTCRVHQITKLGDKRGFEVYIIPDELRAFGDEARRSPDGIGLVGVSCVLTNWSGGWEAEDLGIPVQGILLDYVGCRYHWDKVGIATDTNLKKLVELLGVS